MVVYSCPCLNIQLFADPPSQCLDPENLALCPLGTDVELVELIDQGFQCSQKCLVHRSKAGPWTVYVCVLCKTATHAVVQDVNIVAVSTTMKKGRSAIDNMRQREDFSSVFGLLLNQNEEETDGGEEGFQAQSFEAMQKQLVELQAVLSGYLRREEDAMEQRIRQFEEEQRAKFDETRENCQKQKTLLISLLFNASEGQNNQLSPREQRPVESSRPVLRSHGSVSHNRNSGDGYQEKRLSRPISSSSSSRRSHDSRDLSPDADVFAMDDFEANLEPECDNSPRPTNNGNSPRQPRPTPQSSYSSLESRLRQEDRTNSNHPSSRSRSRGKESAALVDSHQNAAITRTSFLSSSVPISMPMAPRSVRNNSYLEDDIDEEATDFADIPRSMQQLSESIQERDRYIFGDRPRQRVNTGDFTQVQRPHFS